LRDLSAPPRGDVARGGKPAAVRPTRVSGHCPDVGSSAGAPCSVDARAALAQARAGADERNRHRPPRAGFTALKVRGQLHHNPRFVTFIATP